MAKGKKTGGKDFRAGHNTGRPRNPPEINKAASLSKTQFLAKLNEYLNLSFNELTEIVKNKDLPMIDHWVGRIALHGATKGDERRLDFMANRLYGKVKETVDLNVKARPAVIHLPDGMKVELPVGEEE